MSAAIEQEKEQEHVVSTKFERDDLLMLWDVQCWIEDRAVAYLPALRAKQMLLKRKTHTINEKNKRRLELELNEVEEEISRTEYILSVSRAEDERVGKEFALLDEETDDAYVIRTTRVGHSSDAAGDDKIEMQCYDAYFDAKREKEQEQYWLDRRFKEMESRIAKLEGAQS